MINSTLLPPHRMQTSLVTAFYGSLSWYDDDDDDDAVSSSLDPPAPCAGGSRALSLAC